MEKIPVIKIGTRESELAMWQANLVKDMLQDKGYSSELIAINSEGDTDQVTPLYEMGVQGIFTKALDTALLNNRVDIAVHSMKDVPTQLPNGIVQAAVLKRGNYKDVFVINDTKADRDSNYKQHVKDFHNSISTTEEIYVDPVIHSTYTIATSSVRRKAQWLHRYPAHTIVNLRGNINTRMQKVAESSWDGAILAAAGLERINLKPSSAMELDWMLPAPAQGAIMVVCRTGDPEILKALSHLNHEETEVCTSIEKDFLHALMGGCSMPISALAQPDKQDIHFKGSILSIDGRQKIEVEKYISKKDVAGFGKKMANEILLNGGREIADSIRNAK